MASEYTKEVVCHTCGTRHRLTITNGIYPLRMPETALCLECGTQIYEVNNTGDIIVERADD